MIVSKINRDGIDTVIEQFQQTFYPRLLGYWSGTNGYQMYPRANKNYREDQILPEVSLDKKDYSEILFNDKFAVTSFFLVADERPFEDEFKRINHQVSLIFQADLFALYGLNERMDEKFNMDVLRVLKKENFYIHDDIIIIQGIDNVYRDLTLNGEFKTQINVTDISHMHVVRFDFSVVYKPNCNQTLPPVCAPVTVEINDEPFAVVNSGGTLNIEVVDENGDFTGSESSGQWVVNTGGGSSIAEVTNSDGTFNDSFDTANNPYEIPNSTFLFNDDDDVSPLPATLEKTIDVYNNQSVKVGTKVVDTPTSLVILAPDATVNVQDSDGNLLFSQNISSGSSDSPQISDSVVTNSNSTYSLNVLAQGSEVLPDTTINVVVNGVAETPQTFPTLTPNQVINVNVTWI